MQSICVSGIRRKSRPGNELLEPCESWRVARDERTLTTEDTEKTEGIKKPQTSMLFPNERDPCVPVCPQWLSLFRRHPTTPGLEPLRGQRRGQPVRCGHPRADGFPPSSRPQDDSQPGR